MATYTTAYPSYFHSSHHQASAYPDTYQSSSYSLPISPPRTALYERAPFDSFAMPTYYVQGQPSSHSRRSGSRSRTRSYSHAGTGYSQPAYYTSSGVNSRDYAYGDSGRRGRSSTISGGHHYPSGYSGSGHYRSNSYSPQYYTTSGSRRSYSTPRRTVQVADARHSSSGYRPNTSYATTGTHYRSGSGSGYYHEPLGDRIRRWFGLGSSHHLHNHSSWRGTGYVDARTGHPVDVRGRNVYRV